MDDDDVLRVEDLADVRAAVLKTRRRVLVAAVAAPILAALLIGPAVYYLKLHNIATSVLVAAVFFILLGVPLFIHWWRHYRTILGQLDIVAERVASGEAVYGSKVAFHSYR
jgi:hypothetical protein